jgi:hypothetical protein
MAKLMKVRNCCKAEFREVGLGFAMKDTKYAAIQNMFRDIEQYCRVVVLQINGALPISIEYGLTLVNPLEAKSIADSVNTRHIARRSSLLLAFR